MLPRGEAGGRRAEERCAAHDVYEHGFLEADHRASGRAKKGHTVVRVPSLPPTPLEDCLWRVSSVQLVVRGMWRPVRLRSPNRVLVVQDSTDSSEAKVFRAHAPPRGACGNFVCALKLLTNQQLEGDSLVQVPAEGRQEQSRVKMMDELTTRRRWKSSTWGRSL